MNRIFSILLLVSLALIACEKEDEEGIEMSIIETGCLNGWDDFYEDTHDYKHAVNIYLEHYGIKVYSVSRFTYYDGPVCLACSCSTGNMIIIRIRETDQSKAEPLGFQLVINGELNIPGED